MKANDRFWFKLDDAAVTAIRRAVSETLTQSEMMLRASCARKWFYRYALKLEKRGVIDFNLLYGSLMHSLLETLYRSKAYRFLPEEEPVGITEEMVTKTLNGQVLSPDQYEELELTKAKAQIAFDAYRNHYHRQDARLQIRFVEEVLEVEWGGLKLAGKLDLVAKPNARDGVFIWDFKTAGQLDAIALDAWTFRFQFLFYCWLYWKVSGKKPVGTMVNGLVKTGLKPKLIGSRKEQRRENPKEYLQRVKADMIVNRERHFYRQRIPLSTGALERFEHEILRPHVIAFKVIQEFSKQQDQDLIQMIQALAMTMNTNQCHVYKSYCEYLPLCKDGTVALGEFKTREAKHVELEPDLTA